MPAFNSRVYYCDKCKVFFELKVEPGKSANELRSDYQSSLDWLAELQDTMECPSCGKECEEEA